MKNLSVKVTENKERRILLSLQHGKFNEDWFEGEYYTDGATMLFNLSDKRQFSVKTIDILNALKKSIKPKTDPSGMYEKINGDWKPKGVKK
jgi:hypothetical protein